MATLYKHVPYERIARIAPIMAMAGEGIAATQTRAGCDYIINAGTYDFKTRVLDSGLKVDGEYLNRRENHGLGINKDGKLEWSYAGVWVQTWFGMFSVGFGGGALQGKHLTAKAQRTGLGCTENGIILAATTDLLTTKQFAKKYFADADAWINLDGGGSTQWISPEGKFISGREVVWYIGVWLTDEAKDSGGKETMGYLTNLPVNGDFRITAAFGDVNSSLWKNGHKGIDIVADNKTIYSPCEGTVRVIAFDKNGWGRYVSIGSADGTYRHILAHLVNGSVKVKVGQKVTRTTVIGTMGDTGKVTGVHLHYQINKVDSAGNSTPIDPSVWTHVPNKRGSYKDTDYAVDKDGKLLVQPEPEPPAVEAPPIPTHWAQEYYDKLVAAGIIAGDDTSKAWTQFDKPIGEITTGELLALIAKAMK